MNLMIRLTLLLSVFYSVNTFAIEWNFNQGSKQQLVNELDLNLGVNRLFNCELIIEKIQSGINFTYWITVIDLMSSNYTVFEISGVPNERKLNTSIQAHLAPLNSYQKTSQFKIIKGLDNSWLSFEYNEILFNPFQITNNIKCSAN